MHKCTYMQRLLSINYLRALVRTCKRAQLQLQLLQLTSLPITYHLLKLLVCARRKYSEPNRVTHYRLRTYRLLRLLSRCALGAAALAACCMLCGCLLYVACYVMLCAVCCVLCAACYVLCTTAPYAIICIILLLGGMFPNDATHDAS